MVARGADPRCTAGLDKVQGDQRVGQSFAGPPRSAGRWGTPGHGAQLGLLGPVQFAILPVGRALAGQCRLHAPFDPGVAHPMDGGGIGSQGLGTLCVAPAAPACPDIGFEQEPRMEQLRRGGPPGGPERQLRFTCVRVEPDHILDHQPSPLWGHPDEENGSPHTSQVSSGEALGCQHVTPYDLTRPAVQLRPACLPRWAVRIIVHVADHWQVP